MAGGEAAPKVRHRKRWGRLSPKVTYFDGLCGCCCLLCFVWGVQPIAFFDLFVLVGILFLVWVGGILGDPSKDLASWPSLAPPTLEAQLQRHDERGHGVRGATVHLQEDHQRACRPVTPNCDHQQKGSRYLWVCRSRGPTEFAQISPGDVLCAKLERTLVPRRFADPSTLCRSFTGLKKSYSAEGEQPQGVCSSSPLQRNNSKHVQIFSEELCIPIWPGRFVSSLNLSSPDEFSGIRAPPSVTVTRDRMRSAPT